MPEPALRQLDVLRAWWPLALSWLMMGLELPVLSAVVARLPDSTVQLAAFGGIVFPIALIIEAPIIMMLAASTALSRDGAAFRRLRRFMWRLSAALTAMHVLVAFTPLYDVLAIHLLSAPLETLEPGRLGLQIMTPWTAAIADRRFHQGVLIRFGRSRSVGVGTMVRLAATIGALLAGALAGLSGIAVATVALSTGVIVEAIYARLAVAPVVRGPLASGAGDETTMSLGRLLGFYVPLALTPLLQLLAQPIGSAAIARMPDPLVSLAVWPVLNGLVFLHRSVGIAFNEVVVSLADRPGARTALRRFAITLSACTSSLLLLLALTPMGRVWFADLSGLDRPLANLAHAALWAGTLLPTLGAMQSYYQGLLVSAHRTRGIPESVGLFLVVSGAVLGGAIAWGAVPGVYAALIAFTAGGIAQTAWLARRCGRDGGARPSDQRSAREADVEAREREAASV